MMAGRLVGREQHGQFEVRPLVMASAAPGRADSIIDTTKPISENRLEMIVLPDTGTDEGQDDLHAVDDREDHQDLADVAG
jgi:hypothetical protein